MADNTQYMVKDGSGNVYGPATVDMLRQWVAEHRVLGSMMIAPQGTENWQLVSSHPELAAVIGTAPVENATTPMQQAANPYAGMQQQGYAQPAYAQGSGTNQLAIWAMVVGIVGVLCCGILLGPAAAIMGYLSLKQIKQAPGQAGRGMAMAGLIIGICITALNILGIIVYVIILATNPDALR